ncbi:hypothetical protein PR048_015131 [Dryococelus australis]|uniref:Uncharacterized protein n=1 Tax=Dryococelus australis TaxID=614101 RepID=A0ABQ9HG38_9NEOP|nr:hypothetical protein PR048_015131 [Dryococelus australis]
MGRIEVIGMTLEKKTITIHISNGIDSNGKIMSTSLENLAVFPYHFVKCEDGVMCTLLLPKDTFHNVMKGEGISDEDYAHAQTAWDAFHFINLLQYAIQYLCVDTCLLQTLGKFRDHMFGSLWSYTTMYITSLSLACYTLWSITDVMLQLLTDSGTHAFSQKWINRFWTNATMCYPAYFLMVHMKNIF